MFCVCVVFLDRGGGGSEAKGHPAVLHTGAYARPRAIELTCATYARGF